MKGSLFPAFFVRFVCWVKAGAGEMELGQEIAKCKVRNHSCRGVNPAYEHSERNERPISVRDEPV